MEKQQNSNCDTMTTVTVKDYTPGMEYQDPPPSYKTAGGKNSPLVQVTKIVALTAVIIAGMLSFSIVLSAWLTSNNNSAALCQYQQPSIETVLEPQLLRSALMGSSNDLDSAESNIDTSKNNKKDSSSSDEDRESGDDAVTMLKLPLELNLQEHMFEKNHRSHMNCVIEKKKAEEIVDEQSKPLPPLLGLNMSTDPRYLHFTGEKMAISCDSGNDHRHAPNSPPSLPPPPPPGLMDILHDHFHSSHPNLPAFHHPMSGSSNVPVQIIGPIPLPSHSSDLFHPGMSGPSGPQMIPIIVPHPNNLPLSMEETGSIFFSHPPPQQSHQNQHFQLPPFHPNNNQQQIQMPHPNQVQVPLSQQSSEIRERALPHGIPIMPRHHIQHVIRPRSTGNQVVQKRTKRCACDCACKNHVA